MRLVAGTCAGTALIQRNFVCFQIARRDKTIKQLEGDKESAERGHKELKEEHGKLQARMQVGLPVELVLSMLFLTEKNF